MQFKLILLTHTVRCFRPLFLTRVVVVAAHMATGESNRLFDDINKLSRQGTARRLKGMNSKSALDNLDDAGARDLPTSETTLAQLFTNIGQIAPQSSFNSALQRFEKDAKTKSTYLSELYSSFPLAHTSCR